MMAAMVRLLQSGECRNALSCASRPDSYVPSLG